MKSNCFNKIFLLALISLLILFALPTIIIDPLFHYHSPLKNFTYVLNDERYQNNGIVRHFEYDTLITGTSMIQNFKTSEMNRLFSVNSIKVPYSGAFFKEINDNINVALKSNSNLKLVVRSLELDRMIYDKDYSDFDEDYDYPEYLLDENLFSDVCYCLNKTILMDKTLNVIKDTKAKKKSTTFDSYSFWDTPSIEYGKEKVLESMTRPEKSTNTQILSTQEIQMLKANVKQNITDTALDYPNVNFYLFIPPYSICYWDCMSQYGAVDYSIDALEIVFKELLELENIKLFSFANNEDIVCDLDNYMDMFHYKSEINSEILRCMKIGKNSISKENYQDYIDEMRKFYNNYDYDSIYQ